MEVSRAVENMATKSVVVVCDKRDPDAYCSGCVIVKHRSLSGFRGPRTLVIVSSEFVNGRENHLSVLFSDKKDLKASVFANHERFSILSTDHHEGCEAIKFSDEEPILTPSPTFVIAPLSPTKTELIYTYAIVESLEAYTFNSNTVAPGSTDYFMVTCRYFRKTNDGVNRLAAAPVFSMGGWTQGLVLQDCRHELNASGAEMKVAVTKTYLHQLVQSYDPPHQGGKGNGKKRRRG